MVKWKEVQKRWQEPFKPSKNGKKKKSTNLTQWLGGWEVWREGGGRRKRKEEGRERGK